MFPAVGKDDDAPKGLGSAGDKPLMRNLRAPVERRANRDTAGNAF